MKFKPRFRDDNVKFKAKFATTDSVINALEVTENGDYSAPNGVDGFNPVKVNVPIPEGYIKPAGSINITENGIYDVTEYEEVEVEVEAVAEEPVIEPITITENGTYNVPENIDGYGPITVEVAGSGGGSDVSAELIEKTITSVEYGGTQIGDYVFYKCINLSTINIPNVISIGEYAFYDCDIGSINLPKVKSIGNYAFYRAGGKDGVTAPLLETIGSYAFQGSTVEHLSFPELIKIGNNAFHDSKVISVNFPKVTTLGQNIFYYCYYLKTVEFPLALSIPSGCFYECSRLESVSFPIATSLGSSAFRYCGRLQSVNIPFVKTIGTACFNSCSTLLKLVLPSVTTLSSEALGGVMRMESVDIYQKCPITAYTFNNCYSLTTLILRSETMCTLANTNAFQACHHFHGTVNATYNPNGDKDGYIYVPSALIEDYKMATNWSAFADQFRAIEDYPEICG